MIRNVTPVDAQALIEKEGYRYVDVRTEEEFEAGHPAGAVNIPILIAGIGPNPDFVPVVSAVFEPDTPLVLGCGSGGRSMRAAEILSRAGFTSVVNMDGGFNGRFSPMGGLLQAGWAQEGLPVSHELTDETSYASLRSKRA